MEELQIFNNEEFGTIRTAEINGKPYFVASDVATALGYANPRKAVIDHCKGVTKRDTPTSGGKQELSYINEGDVYRLIMRSKLPSAEKFESWVVDEVIHQKEWWVHSKPREYDPRADCSECTYRSTEHYFAER